jgi:hypothetical protein
MVAQQPLPHQKIASSSNGNRKEAGGTEETTEDRTPRDVLVARRPPA